MAQRKRKAGQPKPEPASEQTPIDGVLVSLVGDEFKVQNLGQTRPMEVPTLLRRVAKDVERELGID